MTEPRVHTIPQSGWDEHLLELVACPACRGDLRMETANLRVDCTACGRAYPVEDGIPVLIVDRAVGS